MERFHERDKNLLFSCEELWTSTATPSTTL